MSDDVFEAFGGDDIFTDEEPPKKPEGDGQNRTFIIAVSVLAGLLVCSLVAFGVWAFVLNRPQQAQPTEAVVAPAVTEEVLVEDTPTLEPIATDTPAPTDTPEPTPTPLLGPTRTPTPEGGSDGGDPAAVSGQGAGEQTPTATTAPRRTATPTQPPKPTATARVTSSSSNTTGSGSGSSSQELSQTGLGEWMLVGAAMLLVGIMVFARRARSTS